MVSDPLCSGFTLLNLIKNVTLCRTKQPGRVRSGAKFLRVVNWRGYLLLQKNKSRKSRLFQEPTRTAKKDCEDKTATRGHSARSLNELPHLLTHKLSCRTIKKWVETTLPADLLRIHCLDPSSEPVHNKLRLSCRDRPFS